MKLYCNMIRTTHVWIIPKCCPLGFTLTKNNICIPTNITLSPEYWGGTNPSNNTEIDVIIGDPCPFGKYRLEPEVDSMDEFHLMKNGSLLIPFQHQGFLSTSDYCMEIFDTPSGPTALPLICFPPQIVDKWRNIAMIVYPTGLLLSVPFLLATLFIYSLIPELRDTQGKTLCCHISCLIVAYITLATVQLGITSLSEHMCIWLGFLIQFTFLGCFFWLNVLCFDTCWRITSPLKYASYNMEMKRFLWYSFYAWTLPILLLAYTIFTEISPILPPSYLKPRIGYNCWFDNNQSALQYFYGPMGFVLITNIIFFILSARHIPEYVEHCEQTELALQVNERTVCRRTVEMFKNSAQLFAVMGLSWIMELLSWALGGPSVVWFVTDLINTLQGIIIFYIFVFRIPRVRRLVMQYYKSIFKS
ncbi:G-protein coupled receptor Mth2-like isoform X2 [Lycorma delicatula]|uniref:G-protein coupled receptor Mth2-like isoform X2 n=1 Tax=Lycorma delicatula TaxID=130591 RepID=UPI003F50E8F3